MTPVTCAIKEKDGKVLCARRREHMKHPLKWEFPGGKKEENESIESSLKREIMEELGIEIEILEQLPSFLYFYTEDLGIELFPFQCEAVTTKISLAEHKEIKCLDVAELPGLDWVEADVEVVKYYLKNFFS